VSGCDKGCARPRPADVSLVAGPAQGTYDLYTDAPGATSPKFGERVACGLDLRAAIERIGAPGTSG
jgi:sulfite reductase beta subunit-like hemoprotein